MGYRQGLGHDSMTPLPTTCLVLVDEPAGFWSANKFGKMIERGSPQIALRDITHAQLELAEVVQYELQEGAKAYDDQRAKSAERMAAMLEGLKR